MSKTQIETGKSRRAFLKAGTGLAAGAALPAAASAQGGQGTDPELTRLQSQRRILLRNPMQSIKGNRQLELLEKGKGTSISYLKAKVR